MKTRRLFTAQRLVASTLLGLTFTACATSEEPTPKLEASSNQPTQQALSPKDDQLKTPTKLSPQQQIDTAVSDLATRLSTTEDQITVAGALAVNWRSSAMGCPLKGQNYMDVVVPGISIMLTHDNRSYRYHAAQFEPTFLCPDERAEQPIFTDNDI